MNKSVVYKDIEIAKWMIEDKTNNLSLLKCPYSDSSPIYRFSNEHIDNYKKYLEKRRKILTITASGDQMLSSILLGAKEIDSIDISRFPKYFFELKKAAIKTLSLEEYIRFFVPEMEENQQFQKDKKDLLEMYYAVNANLLSDNKIFWDELLKLYDPVTLYQSKLFRQENIRAIYSIIISNYDYVPYLKNEDTYNLLKSKIDSCTVKHYIGNIFDETENFNAPYDLVNLSNIIDYSDKDEYKKLLDKFNLTEQGIILSYIYSINSEMKYEFRDKRKYKFKKLPTENMMIYKK